MSAAAVMRQTGRRWLKFNLVGAIGIMVQLFVLALLTRILGLGYLLATVLAVEAAVLHNFLWHERFTWADRASITRRQTLIRLIRFNLTTGAVSIVGNLLFMRLLVGVAHLPPLLGNLASITICSLLNFLVSDRIVFRAWGEGRKPMSRYSFLATRINLGLPSRNSCPSSDP